MLKNINNFILLFSCCILFSPIFVQAQETNSQTLAEIAKEFKEKYGVTPAEYFQDSDWWNYIGAGGDTNPFTPIVNPIVNSVTNSFSPSTSGSGSLKFTPLVTDNPFINKNLSLSGLPDFFNTLYKAGISIAVVLAIIMVFYGGFIYTTSSSSEGKSASKRRIQAAIGGLLLALSSYIILRSINSQLVFINLGIGSVTKEQIELQVVTEEGRNRLIEKTIREAELESSLREAQSTRTININIGSGSGGAYVPGSTPQILFDGENFSPGTDLISRGGINSNVLRGIPVKGELNNTQKKELKGDGIERHTEEINWGGQLWGLGTGSIFGGSADTGVTSTETAALNTNIILRNIDSDQLYVAMRFDYTKRGPQELRNSCIYVYSTANKIGRIATPLDWGPNPNSTSRSIDISPGLAKELGYSDPYNSTDKLFAFRFVDGGCKVIK